LGHIHNHEDKEDVDEKSQKPMLRYELSKALLRLMLDEGGREREDSL